MDEEFPQSSEELGSLRQNKILLEMVDKMPLLMAIFEENAEYKLKLESYESEKIPIHIEKIDF